MKTRNWKMGPLPIMAVAAALFSGLLMLAVVGCGSTTDSQSLRSGIFVDGVVEGMEFRAGDRTGLTDNEGKFYYKEGETVYFYIGGLKIGETASPGELTTPINLVTDDNSFVLHPTVTNICRLLQSLDEDLNPDNGIKITKGMRDRIQSLVDRPGGLNIDFTLDETAFGSQAHISDLYTALNTDPTVYLPDDGGSPQIGSLTSKADANKHFFKSMADRLAIPVVLINLGDGLTTGNQSGFGNVFANTQVNGWAGNLTYQFIYLSESTIWNNPLLAVKEGEEYYNEANGFRKTLYRIVDDEKQLNEVDKYLTPYNLAVPGATVKSVIDTRTSGVENDVMTELFRPIPELKAIAESSPDERVEVSQLEAALFLANLDEHKNRLKIFTLWIGAEDSLGVVFNNLGLEPGHDLGSDLTTANITAYLNDTTAGHDLNTVETYLTDIVEQISAVEYAYVFIATLPHVESLGTVFSKDDIEKMALFGRDDDVYSRDPVNVTALSDTELIGYMPFIGDLIDPDPATSISRCLSTEEENDNAKLNANIAQLLQDDANYLSDAEIALINGRIDAINEKINELADTHENVIVVDVKSEIYDHINTEAGYDISTLIRNPDNAPDWDTYTLNKYIYKNMSGGFYSYDGYNPGATGYGAIGFLFMNKIDETGIGLNIFAEFKYLDKMYPALDFEITDVQALDQYAYDEDGDGFMIGIPLFTTGLYSYHVYDAVTVGGWIDCNGRDDTILPYYVGGLQLGEGDVIDESGGTKDYGLCDGFLPEYSVTP